MFSWLFQQYSTYPPLSIALELIAVVCGIISVLLAKRGNVLAYPIGLISTSIFVYLLWQWQLFGDMLINAYYSVVSIYGWIHWSKHSQDFQIQISRMTAQDYKISSILASLSFLFVGLIYYFKPFINNHFSWQNISLGLHHFTWLDYTDMLTTGLFLVAMWLMARRKIEHWIIWIIADTISIPLYFAKGLAFTAVQYIVFTLIAIFAYFTWKRLWLQQHCNNSPVIS